MWRKNVNNWAGAGRRGRHVAVDGAGRRSHTAVVWFTRPLVDRRGDDIHVCGPFNTMSTSGIVQALTKRNMQLVGDDLLTMNVKTHCSV